MDKAEKNLNMIEEELDEDVYLFEILKKEYNSPNADMLSPDFVNMFLETKSGMFRKEVLLDILQNTSKKIF